MSLNNCLSIIYARWTFNFKRFTYLLAGMNNEFPFIGSTEIIIRCLIKPVGYLENSYIFLFKQHILNGGINAIE